MNIKAQFLHMQLDIFPGNLGAISEEQGYHFKTLRIRGKDIRINGMIGDARRLLP